MRAGQPTRIKLAAYPFTKYGLLEGEVVTVSADAQPRGARSAANSAPDASGAEGTSGLSPFKARVRLRAQRLEWNGGALPVAAGMQVQAEIRQGERTVLEYLLSPVRRVASEAGGER